MAPEGGGPRGRADGSDDHPALAAAERTALAKDVPDRHSTGRGAVQVGRSAVAYAGCEEAARTARPSAGLFHAARSSCGAPTGTRRNRRICAPVRIWRDDRTSVVALAS